MRTADFDYELPLELIAQTPSEPRDKARLMALDRRTGEITHHRFDAIGSFLRPGDLLVLLALTQCKETLTLVHEFLEDNG